MITWWDHVARNYFTTMTNRISTAAPLTWNSLPPAVLNCDSTFKCRKNLSVFYCLLLTLDFPFHQLLCRHLMALWRFKFCIIIAVIFHHCSQKCSRHGFWYVLLLIEYMFVFSCQQLWQESCCLISSGTVKDWWNGISFASLQIYSLNIIT